LIMLPCVISVTTAAADHLGSTTFLPA
jgi:hypothetical protein